MKQAPSKFSSLNFLLKLLLRALLFFGLEFKISALRQFHLNLTWNMVTLIVCFHSDFSLSLPRVLPGLLAFPCLHLLFQVTLRGMADLTRPIR